MLNFHVYLGLKPNCASTIPDQLSLGSAIEDSKIKSGFLGFCKCMSPPDMKCRWWKAASLRWSFSQSVFSLAWVWSAEFSEPWQMGPVHVLLCSQACVCGKEFLKKQIEIEQDQVFTCGFPQKFLFLIFPFTSLWKCPRAASSGEICTLSQKHS